MLSRIGIFGSATLLINDSSSRLDAQRFDLAALAGLTDIQLTRLAGRDEDLLIQGATALVTAPVITTPLPAALPMFGAVLAGMGAVAHRRRQDRRVHKTLV